MLNLKKYKVFPFHEFGILSPMNFLKNIRLSSEKEKVLALTREF